MELPQAFRLGDLGVAFANVPPMQGLRKRFTVGAALSWMHVGSRFPSPPVGEGGADCNPRRMRGYLRGCRPLTRHADPSPVSIAHRAIDPPSPTGGRAPRLTDKPNPARN